jgi:hypothetical protein
MDRRVVFEVALFLDIQIAARARKECANSSPGVSSRRSLVSGVESNDQSAEIAP